MKVKLLLLMAASLVLTACEMQAEVHFNCETSSTETETSESCSGGLSGSVTTKAAIDLDSFDPAKLKLDFSSSNVTLLASQNAYLTVTLLDGGKFVDSMSFSLTKGQGNFLKLANPSALSQFLQLNEGLFDGANAQFYDAKFSTIQGVNLIVAEFEYDTSVVSGDSYTFYNNPNNNCTGTHCYQF